MRLLLQSSLFMKMLVYFMIVLAAMTVLLSVVLFKSFEKSSMETVTHNNDRFLSQISYSADHMNENAKNFIWSIYGDVNTVPLMYQTDSDYEQLIDSMDRLNRMIQSNSFVHSVYIFNRNMNRFLATGDKFMYEQDVFYDQEISAMMENSSISSKIRMVPIPRMINRAFEGENAVKDIKVFTYIMYDTSLNNEVIDGAVIVNIKGDYLQQITSAMRTRDAGSQADSFVIDSEGALISTSQGSRFGNVVAQWAEKNTNKLNQDSGYFIDHLDGAKVMINYVSAGSLGWKFVSVTPYETVISDIQKIRATTIKLAVGLLICGLLVAFLLTVRLYTPIRKLVSKASELLILSNTEKSNTNEVIILNTTISEAYMSMRGMLIERKQEILKDLLLYEMTSPHTVQTLFNKYKVSLDPTASYVLVSFRIDHFKKFNTLFQENDRRLFRYAIGNLSHEFYRADYMNEAVDMGGDTVVVIINIDTATREGAWVRIVELTEFIQQWCLQHLKLSVTATIGSVVDQISNVHRAYEEIVPHSNYRLLFGHRAIITPTRIENQQEDQYKISTQEDGLLHEALINGKADKAKAILNEVITKLYLRTYDNVLSNLRYLTYSVYDSLQLIETNGLDRFELDYNSFLNQIHQAETLAEVQEMFEGIFTYIIGIVSTKKDKRSTMLVDTITDYIKQNYTDNNLSLDSISEMMNMSKVYIGRVFRETLDQSVADYLSDIRLEKAMEMIQTGGNKPIAEILDQVGIENKKYFYTLFKKKYGVTISEYKLKNSRVNQNKN
jgi:two-component system response regulator YesN